MPTTVQADAPGLLLQDITVEYRQPRGGVLRALSVPHLQVAPGAVCGICGPSGSGKTTLLYLAGGLLRPTTGAVIWGETALDGLSERECDRWRRHSVGFVFQDFHLVPELSALDNVLLPVWFGRISAAPWRARAADLLAQMGITAPGQRAGLFSRGEQQRVAVARALLHDPAILLADEPTASLDAASGAAVAELLIGAARARGATLLIVSHDVALLARMDVVHRIAQGSLE